MIGTTSIAVLYFHCADKDDAYVSAGITSELLLRLGRVPVLSVVSREDVLSFRDREVEPRELGEALVVDYVIDGRVERNEGRLKVSARLLEVSSDTVIWEGRYEKEADSVVDIINEILHGVARSLKVSLESAPGSLVRRPKDTRAFEFYMKGCDLLSRGGRKNVEAAVAAFLDAIERAPDLAAAHAGAAEASVEMFTFYDDSDRWLDEAMEETKRALQYDPTLTEARFQQGIVHYHRGEYAEAKKVLEEVVQGNSCCYDAYRWLGIISDITGNYDAALKYYETAARIKPYSVEPWLFMNMTHRRKGDVEAALISARRFLEVGIRKLEINPDDEVTLSRFAAIYTLLGEGEKARSALQRILKWDPDDGTVLYNCACTYALLGDHEEALRCLRTALENGYRNVREWVRTDPDFDALRGSQEFEGLLAEFESPH